MKYLITALSVVLFTSCIVSKKKYEQLSHDKSVLEVEKAALVDSLLTSLSQNKDCRKSVKKHLKDIDKLQGDTTVLGDLYRDLINDYVALNKSSNSDAQRLSLQMQRVTDLSQTLEEKNRLLIKEEKEIDSLSENLAARERKVYELDSMLKAKDAYMQSIQKQIESALLAFDGDDLTVEVKNGKVYVSLAEELLFQSGSAEVDTKGQEALKRLASALKDSDVMINVEGHTDDVPLRASGVLKTNWELSVIRATSIVRILQKEGVPPQKIIASGRGEYLPKVNEKTKEARATNRRTEIIISPNLDELFELLEGR
jgi:chemotaxis protein MotB